MKLSDESGTQPVGLPPTWNRICIMDTSGRGHSATAMPACVNVAHTKERAVKPLAYRLWPVYRLPPPAGAGFMLQMDTAFLFSSDIRASQTRGDDPSVPFPCVGAACGKRPSSAAYPSTLVPLYDSSDLSVQDDMPVDVSTNFIMRLKVSGHRAA